MSSSQRRRDGGWKNAKPIHGLWMLLACLAGADAQEVAAQSEPEIQMGGFSMILSVGLGYQNDGSLPEAETGLAGLNLGLGGFVTDRVTIMFRVSGTNVDYGLYRQTSGFGGVGVGYWINPHFNVEGGLGLGFWGIDDSSDSGTGLLLAAKYSFYTKGKHSLGVGIEYAPAFVEPETIHNVGLVFAWQLL